MTYKAQHTYDYIILGCGISALIAAKHLCQNNSVLVIEGYPDPGGNHRSYTIGTMEFDVGAICFNTNDEQFRHFPELLKECVVKDVQVRKICTNGVVGKYPFDWQIETSSLNLLQRISYIGSLLRGRLRTDWQDSASSYAQSRIGEALYRRVGLDLYIRRLFGVDGIDIDCDFALRRMQWLSRETSLRYRIQRMVKAWLARAEPHGTTVVRPLGGFANYYRKALDGLKEHGVQFVFDDMPIKIDSTSVPLEVRTPTATFLAKKLISTIPIDQASALCDLPQAGLPTVTLLSLFVALRGSWKPDCSVLYNFHTSGNWKRITVHSDFYPSTDGYDKHLTVEITVPPGRIASTPECAFADFVAHLREMKLIEGELFLVGSSKLGNAYPIPEKGFKLRRDVAIAQLGARGVICLGRQGKFEYIPHSNVAAMEAIAMLNRVAHEL